MGPEPRLALLGDEAAPGVAEQLAVVQRLGWQAIELRTIEGRPLHTLTAAEFDRARTAIADAGVEVVAIATGIGGWGRTVSTTPRLDADELELIAPRARALGARYLRVMSFANDGLAPERWREQAARRLHSLAQQAEGHGLTLIHENCAGFGGQGPRAARELLATVDHPALRALFDIGNGLTYGYRAIELLQAVLPWVVHVHVKDGVRDGAGGEVRYVLPGAGEAGVADCLQTLLAAAYDGSLVLEPHVHVKPHAGELLAPPQAAQELIAHGQALEQLLDRLMRDGAGSDSGTGAGAAPEVAR